MGFGILLLGYTLAFAFTLSSAYFFADVLGGLLMAYAFSKLSQFHKKFRYPLAASAVYTVSAIARAVGTFVTSASETFSRVADTAVAGSIIVLHFTMFTAIIALSRELGLSKITMKARRNFIVMVLYFTMYSLLLLSQSWLETNAVRLASYLYLFIRLFELVWLVINLFLIGSCLKWIGVEGEDAPDPDPSLWKKLNRSWSASEERIFTPKERRSGENKRDNKKK